MKRNLSHLQEKMIFIFFYVWFHYFHISCIKSNKNEEIINSYNKSNANKKFLIKNIKEYFKKITTLILNKLNKINKLLKEIIEQYLINFTKEDYSNQENYINKLNEFSEEINKFIKENEKKY